MQSRNKRRGSLAHRAIALLSLTVSAATVIAQDTIYYSVTDGTVVARDVVTNRQAVVLSNRDFAGSGVGGAREIAFDPATRLMWYSATDNSVYSVNVDNRQRGPTLSSGVIPGSGVGADRRVAVDSVGRRLLVPVTSGAVQMYDLLSLRPVGSIPSAAFGPNQGALRNLATDPRSGNLWYAHSDGSFREVDPNSGTSTGRVVPRTAQIGSNPGGLHHLTIDPVRNLLVYAVTDGSIASVDLVTLTRGSLNIPSNQFAGSVLGANRRFSSDASRFPASMRVFGSGCGRTFNQPRIATLPGPDGPILGRTYSQLVVGAPRNAMAVMFTGRSNRFYRGGFLPQPIPGAPGCMRLVSPDTMTPLSTGFFLLVFRQSIPADPSMLGQRFYNQLFVTDFTANAAGVVVSNASENVIGNY